MCNHWLTNGGEALRQDVQRMQHEVHDAGRAGAMGFTTLRSNVALQHHAGA
jgi:hypothetical protein